MEVSQAASWDLFHPFLPPKSCWTNIQNSDFQEKYQCHLAEIYRLYQIFTNSDFRSHGFCLSNRSSLFTSQFASYFHHSTPPSCSNLGSFLWPGCSTNETHGTTGVDATSVSRWFSAWLFFWCYSWGAKLASSIWKPNSLKDQLWTKFWNWWPAKSGVNRRFSIDKYSVALDCRNPNPVNYLEVRLKPNVQNPKLKRFVWTKMNFKVRGFWLC